METASPPSDLMQLDSFAQAKEVAAYWFFSTLSLRDGANLHYGTYAASKPVRGHVLILPDCGDFVEKYSELAENFATRGWQVTCLEWRDTLRIQTLEESFEDNPDRESEDSDTEPNEDGSPGTGGGDTRAEAPDWFETALKDIQDFWERAWRPLAGSAPTIVVAHGWGAHLALRWQVQVPAKFFGKTAFILSAPVVQPHAYSMPLALAYLVVKGISIFSLSTPYPGQKTAAKENAVFETNRLTRDAVQFGILRRWTELHPELLIPFRGWDWLAEAFQSALRLDDHLSGQGANGFNLCGLLVREFWLAPAEWRQRLPIVMKKYRRLAGIQIPLPHLVFLTPSDKLVDPKSQERLEGRFLRGRLVRLGASRHDVFHEDTKTRHKVWAEIDRFIARYFFPSAGAAPQGRT